MDVKNRTVTRQDVAGVKTAIWNVRVCFSLKKPGGVILKRRKGCSLGQIVEWTTKESGSASPICEENWKISNKKYKTLVRDVAQEGSGG